MPILERELDLYPEDLLVRAETESEPGVFWWAMYTHSRHEKDLMRRLHALGIPFYGPTLRKRHRSPAGRIREAYLPLFSNYVFLYGDEEQRYKALTTNCVSRAVKVVDTVELTRDLKRIAELIAVGMPITAEARLEPGQAVRVRSGMFKGQEGYVLRRHGKTHLVVAVNFLQQGASVELVDCELEPLY